MVPLSSIFRGSIGLRNAMGLCGRYDLTGTDTLFKSQMNLVMKSRLITSSRYLSAGGTKGASSKADSAFRTTKDPSSMKQGGGGSASPRPEEDPDAKFKKGKFPGLGLPKAVGQPDDLPCIEFGKPTGMYNFVRHQHGDPRGHLQSDGRYQDRYDTDGFHWYDAYTDVPKQKFTIVNGEKMIMGKETRPMEELFGVPQTNIPFHPRRRMSLWGNHNVILRAEFCFFWIPTFIILSLAVPCYTMIYMMDEAVATSMTVKVIGHQWYWVYEVESPPLVE